MAAVSFAQALEAGDLSAVRSVPKADYHCHCYFGTRIENVERWLGRSLARPSDPLRGLQGMLDYASRAIDPYVNSRAGFEFTANAAVDDAVGDGVRRLEMSFDVRAAGNYDAGFAGWASFIESLVKRHRDRIDLRPELGIAREIVGNAEIEDRVREAIDSRLFKSIDLYGDEDACALDSVIPLYAGARSAGMKLKAHLGEFGGAARIREHADRLGVSEIQHGIAAAESEDVTNWLAKCRIRLNVCPSSNVMLGAASSLASHPVRVLFDHGVEVTINTDDLMIFGQSVSQEYLNLFDAGVFSADELDGIRVASIDCDPVRPLVADAGTHVVEAPTGVVK